MDVNKYGKILQKMGALLRTPDGQLLLRELEYEFDHKLMTDDPYRTAYNIGRRDVIKRMKDIAENTDG